MEVADRVWNGKAGDPVLVSATACAKAISLGVCPLSYKAEARRTMVLGPPVWLVSAPGRT